MQEDLQFRFFLIGRFWILGLFVGDIIMGVDLHIPG